MQKYIIINYGKEWEAGRIIKKHWLLILDLPKMVLFDLKLDAIVQFTAPS